MSPDDISTARMAQIIASAPEDGAEGRRSRKFHFKLGVDYLSNDIKEREKNEKKKLGKIYKWGRFTSKFFILDNIRYRNIIFQPSPRKTCSDFWMVVKNRWIQQKKIICHRFIKWKRDQFYESMPGIFDWMLLRLFDFVIDLFVHRFGQMLGQFRPIFLHILTVNLEISQGFENFFFMFSNVNLGPISKPNFGRLFFFWLLYRWFGLILVVNFDS